MIRVALLRQLNGSERQNLIEIDKLMAGVREPDLREISWIEWVFIARICHFITSSIEDRVARRTALQKGEILKLRNELARWLPRTERDDEPSNSLRQFFKDLFHRVTWAMDSLAPHVPKEEQHEARTLAALADGLNALFSYTHCYAVVEEDPEKNLLVLRQRTRDWARRCYPE